MCLAVKQASVQAVRWQLHLIHDAVRANITNNAESIHEASIVRGLDWNVDPLEYKQTIPEPENVSAILPPSSCPSLTS